MCGLDRTLILNLLSQYAFEGRIDEDLSWKFWFISIIFGKVNIECILLFIFNFSENCFVVEWKDILCTLPSNCELVIYFV